MNTKQQGTLPGWRAESDSTFKKTEKISYFVERVKRIISGVIPSLEFTQDLNRTVRYYL